MSDWDDGDWDDGNTNSQYQESNESSRNGASSSIHGRSNYGGRNNDYGKYRGNGRSDGGKRNGRGYNSVETVDLRSDCIGMIIGRGGSNIQRLQDNYNVRINLDKDKNKATVSGNSDSDVKSAVRAIKDQLDKAENRGAGGETNYHRKDRNKSNVNNDIYSQNDGDSSKFQTPENDFCSTNTASSSNNEFELIDWKALNEKSAKYQQELLASYPPLTKDFYQEAPEVASLSDSEVQRIRMENNKTTVERVFSAEDAKMGKIPNPIWKFEQCFSAYPDLLAEIINKGFEKPSPIQAQAWPILLKGEDMIGVAQTGTGKTLAFLLPALIHTEYQSIPRSERNGPNVLVMAPTRELALQIEKEVNKYPFRGMKAVCVYGGGSRRDQIKRVETGVEIIISTPGRLNDLIQANVVDVKSVTYVVLDEADRMLDMGFEPQILKVFLHIRPDRQTVMTSATWPSGVRRLVQKYMTNPIQVCVGSLDLAATHTVEQRIEIVDEEDKYFSVKQFVRNMKPDDKVIIFCSKKIRADDLSSDLALMGFVVTSLHGSRDQHDREQAIADITSGEVRVLIATDVASRGLDIDDVTHVINFDFPRNIEEYVHRVGRTGRAGRTGISISYVTRSDWALAGELISILKEAGQNVPDELYDMADRFAKKKEKQKQERGQFNNNFRGHRSGGYGGGGSSGYRY